MTSKFSSSGWGTTFKGLDDETAQETGSTAPGKSIPMLADLAREIGGEELAQEVMDSVFAQHAAETIEVSDDDLLTEAEVLAILAMKLERKRSKPERVRKYREAQRAKLINASDAELKEMSIDELAALAETACYVTAYLPEKD